MFPGKERGRGRRGDAWTSPALARACARVVGLRGTASFRRRSGRLRVRPRGPEVAGGGSPGREGHGVAEDTRSASPGGRRPRALLCRGPREDRRAWRASGRRGRVGAGGDSWRIVATSAEAISTEAGVSQGPPQGGARAPMCCHHSEAPGTLRGAGGAAAAAQGTRHRLGAAESGLRVQEGFRSKAAAAGGGGPWAGTGGS